jgi:hypothetical protein
MLPAVIKMAVSPQVWLHEGHSEEPVLPLDPAAAILKTTLAKLEALP